MVSVQKGRGRGVSLILIYSVCHLQWCEHCEARSSKPFCCGVMVTVTLGHNLYINSSSELLVITIQSLLCDLLLSKDSTTMTVK